ncbi:MAG: response regulator [Archaeoglobaceae archaeon]
MNTHEKKLSGGRRMSESEIKILIVDDEPAMREVMGLILDKYEIIEASNGYEALEVCERVKPDLILMDIMMPRMDGIEATKAILEKYPEAKIVAITAYKSQKGKEMLDAGAIDILEKPFRRKELEELVHRSVRVETIKSR